MLILADADGFRIDLHQLRQRILQATGNGDRATQRNVKTGELLRRQLRGGVDGCPCFADDHLLAFHLRELLLHVEVKTLGFAGGSTVTDRHQLHVMFFAQRSHDGGGFRCLPGVGIDSIGRHQLAGAVDNRHLHAGTQAGIETHGRAQPGRGRHQQVVQVAGKYVNGFIFGALTHRAHQLGLQMHQHLDAPRPAHHAFTPAVRRGVVQAQTQMIANNLLAVALFRRLIKLRIGIQRQLEHAFVAAAEHRQRAVGRHVGDRLMVIEVVAELRALFLFASDHGRRQVGVFPQVVAHLRQQGRILSKALHQDVARAVQRGFAVGHAFIGVNKLLRFGLRIVRRRVPQQIRQRRQASFNSDLPAGTALRLVGQVEIFEFGLAQRAGDGLRQIVSQFTLIADGLQDRLTTLLQLPQVAQAGLQVTQLRIIQPAGDFLTITCNKRHGVPFIKQANGSFYLFGSGLNITRNNAAERIIHHGYFI